MHDVKTLKLRLKPGDTDTMLNSPWNIAVDFRVDMTFNPDEIASMLEDYAQTENVAMNISQIADRLYYYTFGYPFLISKLCYITDAHIVSPDAKEWHPEDIDRAVTRLLKERNTNFDSLIKNLENNEALYELVFDIIIRQNQKLYNEDNPLIDMGLTYGIFKNNDGRLGIHNRIYEERIYNYMISKMETASLQTENYNFRDNFILPDGSLDIILILKKFREFMQKEYSNKDQKFLERNGRLIFLAFVKPIINGNGYDFKEAVISEEKRLDIIVMFNNRRYVIELKRWYGKKAHAKGIKQLAAYLDDLNMDTGCLVIFDFNKNKTFKEEHITAEGKKIFAVWV